jgi:hypothetical protein
MPLTTQTAAPIAVLDYIQILELKQAAKLRTAQQDSTQHWTHLQVNSMAVQIADSASNLAQDRKPLAQIRHARRANNLPKKTRLHRPTVVLTVLSAPTRSHPASKPPAQPRTVQRGSNLQKLPQPHQQMVVQIADSDNTLAQDRKQHASTKPVQQASTRRKTMPLTTQTAAPIAV